MQNLGKSSSFVGSGDKSEAKMQELKITNQFGFVERTLTSTSLANEESEEKIKTSEEKITRKTMLKLKQENARVFKWKEMLEEYPEKLHPKLKLRARKGIPDSIRGYAWQ